MHEDAINNVREGKAAFRVPRTIRVPRVMVSRRRGWVMLPRGSRYISAISPCSLSWSVTMLLKFSIFSSLPVSFMTMGRRK
jgi:hypothetical protein